MSYNDYQPRFTGRVQRFFTVNSFGDVVNHPTLKSAEDGAVTASGTYGIPVCERGDNGQIIVHHQPGDKAPRTALQLLVELQNYFYAPANHERIQEIIDAIHAGRIK